MNTTTDRDWIDEAGVIDDTKALAWYRATFDDDGADDHVILSRLYAWQEGRSLGPFIHEVPLREEAKREIVREHLGQLLDERLDCKYFRWPGDPVSPVYRTLTDNEFEALTVAELHTAISQSATIMRDVDTGELCVYDACEMEQL